MAVRARQPTARARRLAAEMRQLRETSMLTGEEVAVRLNWSASKVSRIETARISIAAADLRSLLDLYGVTGSERARLIELGRTAKERGWWDAYTQTLREGYSTLIALEGDAESERQYAFGIIPGLLQTKSYAQAIISTGLMVVPEKEIERLVMIRMRRQAVLSNDSPLRYAAVLDEATLRRRIGGVDVMREQLFSLIKLANRPNITLHVLPFSKESHPAPQGAFTIFQFPDASASSVVFLENMTSDLIIEDEREVHQYGLAFDRLFDLTLSQRESISLISQLANEIK